ncbi:tetratricopeptide repeat protein, partial [candidate division KSB3 bacterium]|nr:tetratricopeptide repeat protein [candidate division KSB3 bacterium]MBD3326215.1 tetratricopeptide repeat protein [candidate division KSB3 bacterium]
VQPRHVTSIHIILLAIGLIWVVKTFAKQIFLYVPGPLDLPLLLFLGLGFINLTASTYQHATERELYLALNYALLYFLVLQQLKTARRILGLAFILLLVGSAESLFGIFQYLQGAKTVLGYMTPNIGTINATYFSHNHFAGFLILIIPVALGIFIGTAHLEKKFFLFLLMVIMLTALVLTLSRGGLLSFCLAAAGFFLCLALKSLQAFSLHSLLKILLIGLVLTACIGLFVTWIGVSPIAHRSILDTVLPNQDTVDQEIRLPLWKSALHLVKEFPLWGSGLGTFEYVFLRYRPPEIPQGRHAFHAHNDYLELLIEMGIPGLLLMIWAMWRFCRYVLSAYFRTDDPLFTNIALGGLTGCFALFIHSLFDFNLQIPANALLLCILAAMTTATIHLITQERPRSRSKRENETPDKPRPVLRALLSPHSNDRYRSKPSWGFAFVILGCLGLLVFNFRNTLAMRSFNHAKEAQYQGQRFQAIPLFQQAIAIDGKNALFHEHLGEFYADQAAIAAHADKWYNLALQEYQAAIALNPYNPVYYYHLGWIYAALNRQQDAVNALQQAVAASPGIAFYYETLGNYYLSLQQIGPALNAYQTAIRLDPMRLPRLVETCQRHDLEYAQYQAIIPEDADIRRRFADFLAQQQQWPESKREYRKAIALSDQHPSYYQAMLQACERHHDHQCMRNLWQELWEQDPQNTELPVKIAESFVTQQAWEQAIAQYQAILQRHPEHSKSYERLAQLYQQQGRLEDALQTYRDLLQRQPQQAAIYHKIATLYTRQQDWIAARNTYQQALDAGILQPQIYSSLGQIYLHLDDKIHALEAFEQAVQRGEARLAIYQTLEQLYQAQNDQIGIDLLWNTYVLVNKEHPDALFQLVQHYATQDAWLQAVSLSKEIIAIDPTNADYRRFLAQLYEQQDMLYEAIEQREKVVRLHVRNIDDKLHLAALYEQVNQRESARRQYQEILQLQPGNHLAQQKLSTLGG